MQPRGRVRAPVLQSVVRAAVGSLSARPLPVLARCALVTALAAVWSPGLLAADARSPSQTSAEPAELDAIRVNAYRPAPVLDAATKTEAPPVETSQSVSVISRDELDARGVQNLNDATRYVAGVQSESQGIDNRVDDLSIRGFDSGSWSSNLLLDGLRVPSDGSGSWNRTSLNGWNLERVEVLKGPSSVLYGQLAPGGIVNQVSKTPRLMPEQTLRLQLGSHGNLQLATDNGGANADGTLMWRLVGAFGDGGTQIRHTDHRQAFIAPSGTLKFSSDTRLTLLGLYQEDRGGSTFQFLPYQGSVVPAAEGFIDNRTFLGEPGWNTYDRTIWTAGWLFEHRFNDRWKLVQNARYTHVDSLYRTTVGFGVRGAAVTNLNTLTNNRLLPRRAVQGLGDSDAQTIDTRVQGEFATGPVGHTLVAGFDWQRTRWAFLRQMANVTPASIAIDIFNPVYTNTDFASTLTVNQADILETDRQTGLYLQDQMALGNWRFTLGGRYDRIRNGSLNRLNGVSTPTEDGAFTGRAGALYRFDSGVSTYASFAESFQPAAGTTRDGSAFQPVTGRQWEVGVKVEPKGIDGLVTLSAFDLRQQNVLTADPRNTGAETWQVQTGEVRVQGIELEGRVTPVRGFSVIGAVTRFGSEVTRSNDGNLGNRMARVPDWMGALWLDYTLQTGLFRGVSIGAGVRHVSDTMGDIANILQIPSYTLYDAAIRYEIGRVGSTLMRVSLNASNLGDRRYVATCSAATSCYYGSGRSMLAAVRFDW